jgi:translation initiation factor 1
MTDDRSNSRLVYSTDGGRVKLPPAGLTNRRVPSPARSGSRLPAPGSPPEDGVVRIQRDKKGRGGKTATTVTGLPGSEAELDGLLKALKQHCATGGSREERTLILQGDQRDKLLARLTALGHKAKLAGG